MGKGIQAILLAALELLVYKDMGSTIVNAFVRKIHTIPCEPQNFSNSHGTAQGQKHSGMENRIRAAIQCVLCLAGTPYVPLSRTVLGKRDSFCGVAGDILPFDRLIQGASEQRMSLLNHGEGDGSIGLLMTFQDNCGLILQGIVKEIQIVGGQIFDGHIPEVGLDIVLDPMLAAGQERVAPVVQAIYLHILVHQLSHGDVLLPCGPNWNGNGFRWLEDPKGFFVFNLSDTKICFLI